MDCENTSNVNVSASAQASTVEAFFHDESHSFPVPTDFASLVATVSQEFDRIACSVYTLDADGKFVRVSSDEDFERARKSSPSMRVFLADSRYGQKNLEYKYLAKWLKKQTASDVPAYQRVVVDLVHKGFKPAFIKRHYSLVIANLGDIDKTVEAFRVVQSKTLKRERSYSSTDNSPRKKRRCSKNKNTNKAECAQHGEPAREAENRETRRGKRRCANEEECAQRRAARTAKREAKREKREQRRKVQVVRREEIQSHGLAKQFQMLSLQAYPEEVREKLLAKGFSKLILDGNNMLYITKAIRNCMLSGKRKQAEKMLSVAALAFSQLAGVTTEVVFDQTFLPSGQNSSTNQSQEPRPAIVNSNMLEFNVEITKIAENFPVVGVPLPFSDGTSVLVSAAQPEFATTDDKLISWARSNRNTSSQATTTTTDPDATTNSSTNMDVVAADMSDNSRVIVVTSDRALAGELFSLGVALIEPCQWIALFASLVEKEPPKEKQLVLEWLDKWCLSVLPSSE